MTMSFGEWTRGCSPGALAEIAELWNANAAGRHAFFPWTGELLHSRMTLDGVLAGRIFEARHNGDLVGFGHTAIVSEPDYPSAGVVEALLVDREYRGHGLGTAILQGCLSLLNNQANRPPFIDALGAWPFGFVYNTLADGSERSGVFYTDKDLYRLFRRFDFEPVKSSFVMRAETGSVAPASLPANAFIHIARRNGGTWLDRVFRGRELWDHDLVRDDGRILSRSIFGFMELESHHCKSAVFSLFGVHTPVEFRQKGYAAVNLSHLFHYIERLGGKYVEIHVYSDNASALRLYNNCGFREVAKTVMMHRRNT